MHSHLASPVRLSSELPRLSDLERSPVGGTPSRGTKDVGEAPDLVSPWLGGVRQVVWGAQSEHFAPLLLPAPLPAPAAPHWLGVAQRGFWAQQALSLAEALRIRPRTTIQYQLATRNAIQGMQWSAVLTSFRTCRGVWWSSTESRQLQKFWPVPRSYYLG